MKSIHFAHPPTMNGKLTMRFTDVVVENFKPRELAKVHRQEMLGLDADNIQWVEPDDNLASWDCHWCEYREATGISRPHHHEYD